MQFIKERVQRRQCSAEDFTRMAADLASLSGAKASLSPAIITEALVALRLCPPDKRGSRAAVEPAFQVLNALIPSLQVMATSSSRSRASFFTMRRLSECVGGLRMLSSRNASVRRVLGLFATILRQLPDDDPIRVGNLSNMMFALRFMSSGVKEVRDFVSCVSYKLTYCKDRLTAQAVGNCMYGLQSMDASAVEVRGLVSALAPRILDCAEPLSARNIGAAFYGMKLLSNAYPEICALLTAMDAKLQGCTEELNSQSLGNMMYGLQSMHSDGPEIQALLRTVASKLRESSLPLGPQAISNSFFGLKSMHSGTKEVQEVVLILSKKLANCKEDFSAQEISSTIYGLQNISSACEGVNEVLEIMRQKLGSMRGSLDAQMVSNTIHAMRCMSMDAPAVPDLLDAVLRALRAHGASIHFSIESVASSTAVLRTLSSTKSGQSLKNIALVDDLVFELSRRIEQPVPPEAGSNSGVV
jgi:hypothetical protein